MPDGVVFVENDTIFGVQPADAPPPASFEDVEIVETRGTIYPGLIELHNHLMYDVLPLWQIDRQHTNREQWARDRAYRAAVTGPAEVLRMIPGMSNAILQFVEARCLAAGVTTTQGIDVRSKPTGVIRFADRSLDALLPSASTRITAGRADEILRRRNESACLLIHVAEGTDARARQEFLALADSLDRRVAIVHGTALGEDDLKRVARSRRGACLVAAPRPDPLREDGRRRGGRRVRRSTWPGLELDGHGQPKPARGAEVGSGSRPRDERPDLGRGPRRQRDPRRRGHPRLGATGRVDRDRKACRPRRRRT